MVHAIDLSLSLAVPALILLHLFAAPYTKVEESFNVQAIHDILVYGIPNPLDSDAVEYVKTNYDHATFPGSVPRTFVGASLLAGLARPFVGLLSSPDQVQLLVRAILGLLNAVALVRFRTAVDVAYGRTAGRFYLAFTAVQFHVLYYASRTLPNMFALPLTTEAFRALLLSLSTSPKQRASSRRRRLTLYLLTVSGIIFRSEIALLLLTTATTLALTSSLSFLHELLPSLTAGALIALPLTLGLDTFLWRPRLALVLQTGTRTIPLPVWPELQAFIYNTLQGHASDWGTSPWHSYLTSSLPKLLLNPTTYALCIPLALSVPALRRTSLRLLSPALLFVAAYSALPHKEWRFVIYVLPALTGVAAAGAAWIWTRRAKTALYRVAALVVLVSLPLSLAASTALLYVSARNYPGGAALAVLHARAPAILVAERSRGGAERETVRVHVDNLAAQTGVTRFMEVKRAEGWEYDKTGSEEGEGAMLLRPEFWEGFDFVIAEDVARVIGSWEVVDVVFGFGGVGLRVPEVAGKSDEAGGSGEKEMDGLIRHDTGRERLVFFPELPGKLGKKAVEVVEGLGRYAAARYTKGFWPHVKMKARLFVLRKSGMTA